MNAFINAIGNFRHWLGQHDLNREGHESTIVLEFKTEHDARVASDMLRMDHENILSGHMKTDAHCISKVCGLNIKFRWTESRAISGRWGGHIVEQGGEV